jgi:hemoglobin
VDSEEKKTLYDKIGGIEVIKKVAEKMYEKIYVDPDMNQYYLKTEKSKIKKKFAFFIANITGGPYEWPGKSLREAH